MTQQLQTRKDWMVYITAIAILLGGIVLEENWKL